MEVISLSDWFNSIMHPSAKRRMGVDIRNYPEAKKRFLVSTTDEEIQDFLDVADWMREHKEYQPSDTDLALKFRKVTDLLYQFGRTAKEKS